MSFLQKYLTRFSQLTGFYMGVTLARYGLFKIHMEVTWTLDRHF